MALATSTDTLAVGESRTFGLSPGSALTVVAPPNVRATVTETPNTVSASGVGGNASRTHNLQLAQTVTYGPYPMGGTVVVANASDSGTAVTWVRSDSIMAESAEGAVSLVDADGNALYTHYEMRRVLALGTSITNKWTDTGAASYTRIVYGDSYLFWLQTALFARIETVINMGVSSDTTTMMLARYADDVEANYALFDTLILEPGPNDYSGGLSAATVESNISTMVSAAIGAQKLVILLTPTPSESWTNAQNAVAQEVRQWILTNYRSNRMVRVVDAAALWADPLTGTPLSSMYTPTAVEATRIHPSIGGGAPILGRAIAEVVSQPTESRYTPLGQRDHYELLANPRLQGNNASAARNFYAAAGVTVTGGPDSSAIGILIGTFASVTIAPVTPTGGESVLCGSGGTRITVGAAGSDRSQVMFRAGSSDTVVGGTQYGRWDVAWVANTAQVVGDHRPLTASPLGVLTCIVGGTTHATTAPVAPADYGMTVTDGTVTWLWQRLPAVGDIVVPEVEYEVEAQSGGMNMYVRAQMYRTPDGALAENWANSAGGFYDASTLVPGLWMPRKGVLTGLPATLRNPGVSLRHVFVDVALNFANAATATIRINRVSLRRIG